MFDMSLESPVFEQKKPLHSLLLTMEQEAKVNANSTKNEHGALPYFVEEFSNGDRKMTLLGVAHTSDPAKGELDLQKYRDINPDLVFYEGADIQAQFPNLSNDEILALDPAFVIGEGGENLFLAWNAMKDGKVVRSWDIPMKDQLLAMAKKHDHQAIAGWLVTQALGKLYERGVLPTEHALETLLPYVITPAEVRTLHEEGLDVRMPSLKHACKEYTGFSLEQLAQRFLDEDLRGVDRGAFANRYDPAHEGETNPVLRDMNVLRDEHAIDVLEEAKSRGLNILVAAGGSHVRTWIPAVEAIYNSREVSLSKSSHVHASMLEGNRETASQKGGRHALEQVLVDNIKSSLKRD